MFDKKKKFSAPKEGYAKIIVNDGGRILEEEKSLEELGVYDNDNCSCGCSCGGNCKCHTNPAETIPEDICVPVDPFISYARTIIPDTSNNYDGKIAEPVELWGDKYGNCMMVDPNNSDFATLATEPVVIGTRNHPLGIFIPKHISNEGIDFVCNFLEVVKENREAYPYKALEGFI